MLDQPPALNFWKKLSLNNTVTFFGIIFTFVWESNNSVVPQKIKPKFHTIRESLSFSHCLHRQTRFDTKDGNWKASDKYMVSLSFSRLWFPIWTIGKSYHNISFMFMGWRPNFGWQTTNFVWMGKWDLDPQPCGCNNACLWTVLHALVNFSTPKCSSALKMTCFN